MQHKTLFLTTLLISTAVGANPVKQDNVIVTLFTAQQYAAQQTHLANHIYYLDSVERLEERFLPNLSTDPMQAEQQVRQIIGGPEWKQFETELRAAYQGVIAGWTKGIMKIPAVLFESATETAVIYGETDVAKAIERYRADQQQRGQSQ